MPRVNVKRLVRLSEVAKSQKVVETETRIKKAVAKDGTETKRIAKEILDNLPERLEGAAKKGERSLKVTEMRVSGKRNDTGWVVDFEQCDAGDVPEKYLCGYLKVVYGACKKTQLRTSLKHRHDYGDTDQCVLVLVVSW